MYIGIVLLRWQIIVVCFLYALLGGVLYITFAPKEYRAEGKIMIYRDPTLRMANPAGKTHMNHRYLMRSDKLRSRVVDKLMPKWGEKMGNRQTMMLPVNIHGVRGVRSMLSVSVRTRHREYGEEFLDLLLKEHWKHWQDIQMDATDEAVGLLETKLAELRESIEEAENRLIEYKRLYDIPRLEAKGSMESRYLQALMSRRNALTTELLMLEAQHPVLKDENVGVITDVARLTRETGAIEPVRGEGGSEAEVEEGEGGNLEMSKRRVQPTEQEVMEERGWRNLRVRLEELKQKEERLSENLKPEHPRIVEVRNEIGRIENKLDVAAKIAADKLKDRHRAIKIAIEALESAEYKWKGKNVLASQRRAELSRIANVLERYEENYNTLYERLHDTRVSERLKAQNFEIVEPVKAGKNPVWPDAGKILMMVLVLGLGAGAGITVLAQIMDNRIQSVEDIEKGLGIPFIGGVPYWAHGGLERAVRPIVTEEHSAGALEAYRSLRTTILNELDKRGEKVAMFTSADSREGKTLTVLNIAILTAQMGKKVLLVDMDLRKGRLHRSLDVDREPGISDVLRSGTPLKDFVLESQYENLSFIPTGSAVDDAAEILQSADLRDVFDEAIDEYDYIFMDTSPVLRVTDMAIIASQGLGISLFISRADATPKPLVKYALDMLSEARVLGLILNSIEFNKVGSLYYSYQYPAYAYYSNAYAYGYDYYYYDYGDKRGQRKSRGRRHPLKGIKQNASRWFRRMFLPMD
jgi:capsular exopolysaccharide synthesis family protein